MTTLKFEYDEDTGAIVADSKGLHIHTSTSDSTSWFFFSGEIPLESVGKFIDENKPSVADWKIFGVREDGLRRVFIKLNRDCNIFEMKELTLLMKE